MGQGMVRVDRGDGKLLQFQPGDVQKFISANPGAHVVEGRSEGEVMTPAEVAATAAAGGAPNFASMRRVDLDAYAAERGIDISGASNKEQVIERIEAAGAGDDDAEESQS